MKRRQFMKSVIVGSLAIPGIALASNKLSDYPAVVSEPFTDNPNLYSSQMADTYSGRINTISTPYGRNAFYQSYMAKQTTI